MSEKVCLNGKCEKYDNVVRTKWTFCPYCGEKLVGFVEGIT